MADSTTGNVLVHRPLPPEHVLPILHFALDRALLILVHHDGHYLAHPTTIAAYPDVAALVLPPWTACTDLDTLVGQGSTFLRALGESSVRHLSASFEQQYAGRLRFVELAWRGLPDLGIYDACVSKGNTLRAFCQERGIGREEVIAIGDHRSDASMFEAAGLRIAMANADSELKAVADFVTCSNVDDGVAAAIERFFGPVAASSPVPPD